MPDRMLTRDAPRCLLAILALAISGCGSKGDLILPKAGGEAPPARTRQQSSTPVPIVPAIPSPPSIPAETAPPAEPKQP